MSDKETALEVVQDLPEEVSLHVISEHLAILARIRDGIKAADEGRVHSHEEVKAMITRWVSR